MENLEPPLSVEKPSHMDCVHLYNRATGVTGEACPPSYDAALDFIRDIEEELGRGKGIVPLIGAGFSVSAGIPIVQQLAQYLQRCICVALGAEDKDAKPWNPRTDRWPPFIDRSRPEPTDWAGKVRGRILENPVGADEWATRKLHQEAYGAMAEWRTALYFLSRLLPGKQRLNPSSSDGSTLPTLGIPEHGVVDACLREVMRNKRPTLNHRMLAALSQMMRIDIILTTNFDNLVEEAFGESRNRLEAFDVHLGDGLPDLNALTGTRSIVKMHGTQRSLRADYSLDGTPTAEDRQRFCEYLAGQKLPSMEEILIRKKAPASREAAVMDEHVSNKAETAKSHLLVMGVGGNEQRTIDLITNALTRFDDLLVFWIAYSPEDVNSIALFVEKLPAQQKESNNRLRVLRHTNVGLLLLHTYQQIRKTLPSYGALFPSTTRLALPPLPSEANQQLYDNASYKEFKSRLSEAISPTAKKGVNSCAKSIILATGPAEEFGVGEAGAEMFRKFESGKICLWFDMNDIHSADNLFEAFQETAYRELGEVDWTPLYAAKDDRPRGTEVKRIVDASLKPWLVFLNARQVPGSNQSHESLPNGWIDRVEHSIADPPHEDARASKSTIGIWGAPPTNNAAAFKRVILDLTRNYSSQPGMPGKIQVVLLCNGDDSEIKNHLLADPLVDDSLLEHISLKLGAAADKSACDVIKLVLDWTSEESTREVKDSQGKLTGRRKKISNDERAARRRFLHTLVLMQRPRHLAVAWARCVNVSWTTHSRFDDEREVWIKDLVATGLVQHIEGGFISMHGALRQVLRQIYAQISWPAEGIKFPHGVSLDAGRDDAHLRQLAEWTPYKEQADIHESLATWYRKVSDAISDIPGILETIDHLCFAARCCIIEARFPWSNERDKKKTVREARDRAVRFIDTAREMLEENIFKIQTHGHPRASIRRLDFIRDFWTTRSAVEDLAEPNDPAPMATSLREEINQLSYKPPKEDLSRAVIRLQCVAVEGARAICLEVGEDGEAYERQRELGVRMTTDQILSLDEVISLFEGLDRKLSDKVCEKLRDQPDRKPELVRWYRWNAQLGTATRSLGAALAALCRALAILFPDVLDGDEKSRLGLLKFLPEDGKQRIKFSIVQNLAKVHQIDSKPGKLHIEALRCIEAAAFNLMLLAHMEQRRLTLTRYRVEAFQVSSPFLNPRELLVAAERFGTLGLQYVEAIQNDGKPRFDHDLQLHWCKSRLLMVVGLSSLHDSERKRFSRHPMGYLGDAAAALNSTRTEAFQIDQALIDLRSAEIRLNEAASVRLFENVKSSSFQTLAFEAWMCDRLRGESIDIAPLGMNEGAKLVVKRLRGLQLGTEKAIGEISVQANLNLVVARATDALRFLDRAEPVLHNRRRAVWWTTWFFERRIRAISLILWATVNDGEPEIPFLGLEAAMRGIDTEVDVLLEDANRMIRVDAYRLAMVLLGYVSCARALHLRLELDKAAPRLPDRLHKMRGNIGRIRARLIKIVDLRQIERREGKSERDRLEPCAEDVIEEVKVISHEVWSSLPFRH